MVVGLDQTKTASNAMLMQRCTLHPCMAELLAIQEILLWLKDEHFDNVLIELYCKYAIVALCLLALNFSELGVILQDCTLDDLPHPLCSILDMDRSLSFSNNIERHRCGCT
ncbi:hypothetical protein Golax_002423, partial [Gossypium laxum]|nr:hypothetical protein [Gossypium laxum]